MSSGFSNPARRGTAKIETLQLVELAAKSGQRALDELASSVPLGAQTPQGVGLTPPADQEDRLRNRAVWRAEQQSEVREQGRGVQNLRAAGRITLACRPKVPRYRRCRVTARPALSEQHREARAQKSAMAEPAGAVVFAPFAVTKGAPPGGHS